MKKFASLHNHTDLSNASCGFADCMNKIEDLIDRAIELGLAGVAITDHETISAHIPATQYMQQLRSAATNKLENFKLVLGNECYLAKDGMSAATYQKGDVFHHFILLALDKTGNDQIRALSNKAWNRSFMRSVQRRFNYLDDFDIIRQNRGHVVATTACIGNPLGSIFLNKDIIDKKQKLEMMTGFLNWGTEVFGKDNFFIELAPEGSQDQIAYNMFMYKHFAATHNFTIATDSHYLKKDEFDIFKAFLNSNSTKDREVEDFYSTAYMMNWEEIEKLTPNLPSDFLEQCRLNTLKILDRVEEYDFKRPISIPIATFNEQEVLTSLTDIQKQYEYIVKFFNSEYLVDRHYLYKIFENYDTLINPNLSTEEVYKRINLELSEVWEISNSLNDRVSKYFITIAKGIDIIWEEADAFIGPSRGSAAAFITNYLLGIVQWNPMEYPVPISHWRFLTGTRPDMPDIDIDCAGNKREDVLAALSNYFKSIGGAVTQVCAYKTEASRSALRTMARGLKIDDELALYATSLLAAKRGIFPTIDEAINGSENFEPIPSFIEIMNNNPQWYKGAKRIEGLITGLTVHASGVLITNEPIEEHHAIMKTNKGIVVTANDLHQVEYAGYIKYDFLSIDGLGKIRNAFNLLLQHHYIKWQGTLRKTYNKYLAPNVLKTTPELWQNIAANRITSLWQLNTDVGQAGLAKIHATELKELGIINSLMRLQVTDPKAEQPIDRYKNFRDNIELWYQEMEDYGLTSEEIEVMKSELGVLNGVADSQEAVMQLSMNPHIAGFSIKEANILRKGIAKKSAKAQEEAKQMFYEKGTALGTSNQLLNYVWDKQIAMSLGYSFSVVHTAGYSMIALQQANLYTYYPHILWNTACLLAEVGSIPEEDFHDLIELGYVKKPYVKRTLEEEIYEMFMDSIDEADFESTEEIQQAFEDFKTEYMETEEKKGVAANRGKTAKAISDFQKTINIDAPDINISGFGFVPNIKYNSIACGLKVVSKIGDKLLREIINNRPYTSLADFLSKVKISKDRVTYLIKAGCFRNIEKKDRLELLREYVDSVSDKKSRLTLQNAAMLISNNLLPKDTLDYEIKVFNWMKYIRKTKLDKTYFILDDRAKRFYLTTDLELNKLEEINGQTVVSQSLIESFYKRKMETIKKYIKEHEEELLEQLNTILFNEQWKKYKCESYAEGEMQSMRIYITEHPLANVNTSLTITPLNEVEDMKIVGYFLINKEFVPEWKIYHIIGTVIDKNKLKNTITLLTPQGTIDVKIYKQTFAHYDKTIVEFENGEKKIIQPSFFEIGTQLLVTGRMRGTTFIPKKYKKTPVDDVLLKVTLVENNQLMAESKISEDL